MVDKPRSHSRLRDPEDSAADTIQLRSISELRFVERLGVLSASDLGRIEDAIRLVLGL